MTTQLSRLRSDLKRLQASRRMIRVGNGFSLLLTALVVILLVAFGADLALDMSWAQRVVLLGLVIVAAVWAFRRFTKPWLDQQDDEVELALQVERHHGIDSDLVSAMQFEDPDAASWGSEQLETAVITQVAELSPKLDVFEGFSAADLKRRTVVSAVAVAVLLVWAAGFTGYFTAFFDRLLLGSGQYPTETEVIAVDVNSKTVFANASVRAALNDKDKLVPDGESIRCPFGQPVHFHVSATGEVSENTAGSVQIQSIDGRIATEVALEYKDDKEGTHFFFTGDLPRLMDSVSYTVLLGDARVGPFQIDAIPLPAVDLQIDVTPPPYAAAAMAGAKESGKSHRQLSVVEGSRVEFRLKCLNKKLDTVRLTLGEDDYGMITKGDDLTNWFFPAKGTALESVSAPLKYRIQVRDEVGLELENAIHGTIRLKTDQGPRASVSLRTRRVVPTAKPPIVWSATDDFGLSRVVAQIQVANEDGEVRESEVEVTAPAEGEPAPTQLKGVYRLDLEPLKLVKGDELKVTFVAFDYRGELESQKSYSEPLMLSVTDRQGILSGLLETDEESAKKLDDIIRRELGIRESK